MPTTVEEGEAVAIGEAAVVAGAACAVVALVRVVDGLISPEATPAEAVESVSVCIVMPEALPAVAAPMVRPLRVMATGEQQAMLTLAVVMRSDVAAGRDTAPVKAATDEAKKMGVAVDAKNPVG